MSRTCRHIPEAAHRTVTSPAATTTTTTTPAPAAAKTVAP
jgi:hypothetical protein